MDTRMAYYSMSDMYNTYQDCHFCHLPMVFFGLVYNETSGLYSCQKCYYLYNVKWFVCFS